MDTQVLKLLMIPIVGFIFFFLCRSVKDRTGRKLCTVAFFALWLAVDFFFYKKWSYAFGTDVIEYAFDMLDIVLGQSTAVFMGIDFAQCSGFLVSIAVALINLPVLAVLLVLILAVCGSDSVPTYDAPTESRPDHIDFRNWINDPDFNLYLSQHDTDWTEFKKLSFDQQNKVFIKYNSLKRR